MPYDKNEVARVFTYQPPDVDKRIRHKMIRIASRKLADLIVENTPDSRDRELAIDKLRECVMYANAAIALERK